MDLSFSMIRVVIPPPGAYTTATTVCDVISGFNNASYPTPIFSENGGIQITFMIDDTVAVIHRLRSIGQKPKILSTKKYSTTEIQRNCPNCGWIIPNPECMRCKK
jgi:hypothetical protein